jgi:hypothetical protein
MRTSGRACGSLRRPVRCSAGWHPMWLSSMHVRHEPAPTSRHHHGEHPPAEQDSTERLQPVHTLWARSLCATSPPLPGWAARSRAPLAARFDGWLAVRAQRRLAMADWPAFLYAAFGCLSDGFHLTRGVRGRHCLCRAGAARPGECQRGGACLQLPHTPRCLSRTRAPEPVPGQGQSPPGRRR